MRAAAASCGDTTSATPRRPIGCADGECDATSASAEKITSGLWPDGGSAGALAAPAAVAESAAVALALPVSAVDAASAAAADGASDARSEAPPSDIDGARRERRSCVVDWTDSDARRECSTAADSSVALDASRSAVAW